MNESLLTECKACGKGIARTANVCPGCGAANNFVHPKIQEFVSKASSLQATPKFTYHHTGLAISGAVSAKVRKLERWSKMLWIPGVILWVFLRAPFSMIGILLILVGIAIFFMSLKAAGSTKKFSVNYSGGTPVWTSNDDPFWTEVKGLLT